jgi:hypothetical protein
VVAAMTCTMWSEGYREVLIWQTEEKGENISEKLASCS